MNVRFAITKGLLGLLTLCLAWVVWDNWGRFVVMPHASTDPMAWSEGLSETDMRERGHYLAQIGGCIGCHTPRGQAWMSGGKRIDTPYGPAYSSNLTPSPSHGLGRWTLHDFALALRWGRSKDGRLLLPVFPYNHTSVLRQQDVAAIFLWLQSLPAVEQPSPAHRITWPLATQPVMAVWRSLFFTPSNWQPDAAQSQAYNLGAYWVQGAGHCAACHGARNRLGGFPAVDDLSGGFLVPQFWVAPSLVDARQTALQVSSVDDVAMLLRAGQNAHATVSGPMAEFVQQSSQYLTQEDALAMATYLKAQVKSTGAAPTASPWTVAAVQTDQGAGQLYQTHCADCHGSQGQGKASVYPALAGNPAVQLVQPENLIQSVLYGGFGPSTALRPRPHGMPPFLFKLGNEEVAQVLTHVRQQWGNHAPEVTPAQVDRVRAAQY